MSEPSLKPDYLAPNIRELTAGRAAALNSSNLSDDSQSAMTRTVAKRLLPASVVTPALLWWVLILGVHLHRYSLETCFTLFVFSVTLVFGLIVCLNLRKLSRMDAERAVVERQLTHAKETAEAANRFKSAFFANISHEIRTPLTAINGFAELLLNPQRTSEERLSDARVIRRNGEHLLTLINDILDLSKIEAGKMSVDCISCCPAEVICEAVSMLRHRAEEKMLKLDVKFEGPMPRSIRTDPTRLRQVLINLIANAVKFTRTGGVTVTASIKPSFKAAKPLLEVKVTDTGIGIAPDQQAALFQPFVQGDATIARQYGGSGLGLAISRHFAKALDGDISLESMPGRGSTFTLTVGTGSLFEAIVHENPEKALENQQTFNGPRLRINGSILVAEDGIDNQNLIAARLGETGVKLELACNGQVAVEKARAAAASGKPFDLILMDVQMPVMDGFTATIQLRGQGYRGPIIALTANAMERDREKCLSAGCNDFVTKPIQMARLFKAIGRYMKVTECPPETAATASALSAADRAALAKKFQDELALELEQLQEAIEREDRVQLREVAQLLLGKAATAELKDVAVQSAKLVQTAGSEAPWDEIRRAVGEFARAVGAPGQRQAA
jgi:signal transduction histidine kinase/DNA-binding response OmpR family regulator